MTTLTTYPCDRGSGGPPVGWHHFQLSPGARVAVCVFCGKPAAISTDRHIQTTHQESQR